MATHENYDSAISSLIVQVICCVCLPVLGRSSTFKSKGSFPYQVLTIGSSKQLNLLQENGRCQFHWDMFGQSLLAQGHPSHHIIKQGLKLKILGQAPDLIISGLGNLTTKSPMSPTPHANQSPMQSAGQSDKGLAFSWIGDPTTKEKYYV